MRIFRGTGGISNRGSIWTRLALGASVFAVTACGAGDPTASSKSPAPKEEQGSQGTAFPKDLLPSDLLPDLPLVVPKSELDTPVFSSIVDVPAGGDVTFCTFTELILDEPTIFGESYGSESPYGHHALLQYTTTTQEPHTGSCGAMDGQMLLGATGGHGAAETPTLPTNYGVELPAGAQLVINHHWINTSDHPVKGQAMMLARRLAAGGDTIMAGTMAMIGLGWQIPASSKFEYQTACKYDSDVPYVMAIGHMHEYGQHVRIDVDRADGTTESLIDEVWNADSATTAGGGKIFTLDNPFTINKGDTARLSCDWANGTAAAIEFPREMCVFFGYTIGASHVCANGSWLGGDAANLAMGQVQSHL
jgi:hypothetical protein